jgi:hypothetical protein
MLAGIGSFRKAMARPGPRRGRGRHWPGRVAGATGVAAGLAVALAACTSAPPSKPAAAGTAAPPPRQLEFFKPPQSTFNNAGLANADTSYLLAYLVRPPAADVVVVTAKAPSFAPGSHPSPWPARGEDVRYWSMCIGLLAAPTPVVANKLPGGGTDYGCRAEATARTCGQTGGARRAQEAVGSER